MPRKETDWQVGPVLKQKPDSQGTLFRGGTKHSSDARFPRRYTPERLAEVKDAMGLKQSGDYRVGGAPTATFGLGTAPERRTMIDTIARSTVPAEHIKGIDFAPGQAVDPERGENGAYHRHGFGNKQAPTVAPKISIAHGESGNSTVIHEIGHHVSAENGTNAYRTPPQMGAEEGRADAYRFEHYRDRQGRAMTSQHRYLGVQWQHGDTPMDFHNAYSEQTSHIPDAVQDLHRRAHAEGHPIQQTWNFQQTEHGQPGLFDLAEQSNGFDKPGTAKFYDKPELHHE